MKKNFARVSTAFLALFAIGFLFQPQVYAAKIVSGGATKYYVQVKAEKGDSPYSIARMFVDSDATEKRNPTEVAADFLALNGIRAYNKKGNPLIYPGKIYLVPTQAFYKAMNEFVANLDAQEKTIAPAMAIAEVKKNTSIVRDMVIGVLVGIILIFVIIFLTKRSRENEERGKVGDKNIAGNATNKMKETIASGAQGGELFKPPSVGEMLAPLPNPVQGIALGDRVVNALRTYTMEEVAEALETDVIPVIGNNRHIKLRNLPESLRKHPEWRSESLHNIITRAEREVREKKQGEQEPDDARRPHPSCDHRGL